MIGWFTRHDVEINPRKVPASLFSRDEGFGVDSADKTGSIRFDLLVDESHTLEFEVSDHPIENGAVITDHVTQKLRTCTVTGMFTNFPDRNEFGESTDGYTGVQVSDGTPVKDNRARDLFIELENLAMQRKPVRLVTALHEGKHAIARRGRLVEAVDVIFHDAADRRLRQGDALHLRYNLLQCHRIRLPSLMSSRSRPG